MSRRKQGLRIPAMPPGPHSREFHAARRRTPGLGAVCRSLHCPPPSLQALLGTGLPDEHLPPIAGPRVGGRERPTPPAAPPPPPGRAPPPRPPPPPPPATPPPPPPPTDGAPPPHTPPPPAE